MKINLLLICALLFTAWGCITYAPINVDVEGDVDVNIEIDGGLIDFEGVPEKYKDRVRSVFDKLLREEDAGI